MVKFDFVPRQILFVLAIGSVRLFLIRYVAPVISVSGPPSSYQINAKQVFFEMR